MKKLFVFLACVMLSVLSCTQKQETCSKEKQPTAEDIFQRPGSQSRYKRSKSTAQMLEMLFQQAERVDSVSLRDYTEVAYPSNIADEVAGMCERETPMGIFIMLLGSFTLLGIGIAIVTGVIKLLIICISNNKKKEE